MIFRLNRFCGMIILFVLALIFLLILTNPNSATVSSSEMSTSISLPILMYHHMSESWDKVGRYTVHVDEFESDLIFIAENGYTTVTINEVIAYVNGEGELPQKPIMITFDDGFYSTYSLAMPLLEKYEMKAVVSVIGSVAQIYSETLDTNVNYANLNWADIELMNDSEFIEIQSHTWDMHGDGTSGRKGISRLNGETFEQYELALSEDLSKMQAALYENCSITATTIAYPYGAYSSETLEIIKNLGFEASFVCEQRVNTITVGDADSLYNLGRYNRASGDFDFSFLM